MRILDSEQDSKLAAFIRGNNIEVKKNVIYFYTISDLKKDELMLPEIKKEEIPYLKEVGENTVITLSNNSDNAIDAIKTLRENNKNNKITITITDKKKFNKELFNSDIDLTNVFIKADVTSKEMPISNYIKNEKILYSMVKEAENLSPLEKYLYAYDVVKKFKEYKEYKEYKKDKTYEEGNKSRKSHEILFNNYIVCSGFTTLLGDLLDKLDINWIETGVEVEMSSYKAIAQLKKKYDWNKLTPKEKYELIATQKNYIPHTLHEKHSRLIVNINDPKYQIDGLYFADPTWDNDLENNLYTHSLMTESRALESIHKLKVQNNESELFYSRDINEFFDKINYTVRIEKKAEKTLNESDILKKITIELFRKIEKLDSKFVNELKTNYQIDDIEEFSNEVTETEKLRSLLFDMGNYIVKKNNNTITGKTLISAIKEVYKDVYVGGLTDKDIKDIISENIDDNIVEFNSSPFKL